MLLRFYAFIRPVVVSCCFCDVLPLIVALRFVARCSTLQNKMGQKGAVHFGFCLVAFSQRCCLKRGPQSGRPCDKPTTCDGGKAVSFLAL